MRYWKNIVEYAMGGIPDFTQFVTPALIDHLLTTGLWSEHGSDLFQWWDEGALDYFADEDRALGDMPYDAALAKDRDAVASVLKRFVLARAGYINRSLKGTSTAMQSANAESPLYRAICVNDQWLKAITTAQRGALPVGIYWGLDHVEPWGANFEETSVHYPHVVEITTRLKHVAVNWEETFLSRIDWLNGDEEQEIQLHKGSAIEVVESIKLTSSQTHPEKARQMPELEFHPGLRFIA